MWHRAARLLALAALAAGIGVGAYTYYGPTGIMCTSSGSVVVRGGASAVPTTVRQECHPTRMADSDPDRRALALIAFWSLAPALALLGSFAAQPIAVTLASVAFVIELLSFIGVMSVGLFFFMIVLPLTGLALFAAVMPRRRAVG